MLQKHYFFLQVTNPLLTIKTDLIIRKEINVPKILLLLLINFRV